MLYFSGPQVPVTEPVSCGSYVAMEPRTHARRNLNTFVLLLGRAKENRLAQHGEIFSLRPNCFLLLPAGVEHYGVEQTEMGQAHDWCHFHVHSPYVLCEDATAEFVLPEYGENLDLSRAFVLFHQLMDCFHSDRPYRKEMSANLLQTLLCELASLCADTHVGTCGSRALVSQVCGWIRLHNGPTLKVSDVAAAFHYSEDHLGTLFRRTLGVGIHEYMIGLKMEHVKRLLLETNEKVGLIAAEAGFSDEKHFFRTFRQREGMTPTQYRNAYYRTHTNST